jgi:allantoin racemase
MRILVINPNTTDAMTRDIEAQARRYAAADSEVEAISPRWGPASIEGHLEEELAAVATVEAIAERAGRYDGVVIACYGDPGLYAARARSRRSRSWASPRRRCSWPAWSPTGSRS